MTGSIRNLLAAAFAALALCGTALAQGAAPATPPAATVLPKGPPAGFAAPADPKPDESNAQRAQTQPGNNAPFWRAVRESGTQAGTSSLPGVEKGVLIQPFVSYPGTQFTTAGEAWREARNRWIIPYGGALLLIIATAIALFYWRKGPLGGHSADTGRTIERFTYFERAAHWALAVSFIALAVSGLVIAFGKFFLLPVLGATLFGWLAWALKTLHNFAGPLFAVALLVFVIGYARDNLPRAHDLTWLAKGGGMLSGHEVPSGRFNAGEKVQFWIGVVILGLAVVGSGLVLNMLLPSMEYTRGQMQIAHIIHAAASVLMMGLIAGHIYLGSVGVKGAYQGMVTGQVDEAWAREHHELWYDDIKAGKIPAQRTGGAAAGLGRASHQT